MCNEVGLPGNHVALVGTMGFAVLALDVDLQVGEITGLLQLPQLSLGELKIIEDLGSSDMVRKLQLLLLCVQNGDPLILRAVSNNYLFGHILLVCFRFLLQRYKIN